MMRKYGDGEEVGEEEEDGEGDGGGGAFELCALEGLFQLVHNLQVSRDMSEMRERWERGRMSRKVGC